MSFCAYGELVKPGVSNIVLYCDRKTHTSFNWPIPGGALLVRVCEEHGDELERRTKEDPGAPKALERSDPTDLGVGPA